MSLTDQEAWDLADAVINNKDLLPILENIEDSNISNNAVEIALLISDINPNNPDSTESKLNALKEASALAEEIIKDAEELKKLYQENEKQREEEEIALKNILDNLELERVQETNISVTKGFDLNLNKPRKELTTPEKRLRRDNIIIEILEIIDFIELIKIVYLPNKLVDPDIRNINIYKYLSNSQDELISLKRFDMANILLRSSSQISAAEDEIQKIINFYNDWDSWNPEIWKELNIILNKLNTLTKNMEKYEIELSLD